MSLPQREKYVQDLATQRAGIQKKINEANEKRRAFVANAAKNAPAKSTLEEAILASAKEEAQKKGYTIK
jgi:hypothetical protein